MNGGGHFCRSPCGVVVNAGRVNGAVGASKYVWHRKQNLELELEIRTLTLMTAGFIHSARLIVRGNFKDECFAGFIHTDNVYFCAFTTEFQDNSV